jgi:peroxiredoxin
VTTTLAIGEAAPAFELPDTDRTPHTLGGNGASPAPATVVVFTCNHCPYALAWHDRLLAVARDYADQGVRVLFVNPNDGERYPRDSFEAMQARVRADGGWPAPYLRDEEQTVARAYGALTTPDVFLVGPDGAVAYRGAPDADHGDPSLDAAWLRAALDDVLAGRPVANAETKPVGCSVKWRR